MNHTLSIGFIGGGNMASALAAGLVGRRVAPTQIHVVDINQAAQAAWKERGVSVSGVADERLSACGVWVYAVKPQVMREVVAQTKRWLNDSLIISIAAGIQLDVLAKWLGADNAVWQRVVRCMPNTPALIGAGVSGLAGMPSLTESDRSLASELLGSVGDVVWVNDDAALDAVTALSGSGPAYVFLFLQALIDGAISLGLDAQQARSLALGTLSGATRLAAESTETPDVLRARVTSPGGTTAAALQVMLDHNLPGIIQTAMQQAAKRATELGQEFSST